MSIGSNIKAFREERKLTQEQVAEALGISFQAVSSWERDEYNPDTDKLIRLAEVLGVSVSALVEEKQRFFKTKETIYDWVKDPAKKLRNENQMLWLYRGGNGVKTGYTEAAGRCLVSAQFHRNQSLCQSRGFQCLVACQY